MDIRPAVLGWLEATLPGATIRRLAGDASSRSFHRITDRQGGTRIVMDYGEPFVQTTDDIVLTGIFERAGLPVARILDSVPEQGFLVLEDLGSIDLETAFRSRTQSPGAEPLRLLERAVDLAASLADLGSSRLAESGRAAGPALDPERFRFEMDFFVQHYALGLCRLDRVAPELTEELRALADLAAATPTHVLCHRDFHSRNLIVRSNGELAMVDIQDARWGPDSYDLASLLRDAYIDLDEAWITPLVQRFESARIDLQASETFRSRFDIVSAQRMIKALGTFGYQTHVLGRQRYMEGVPRTVGRLARLLPAHPDLQRLADRMNEAGLLDGQG